MSDLFVFVEKYKIIVSEARHTLYHFCPQDDDEDQVEDDEGHGGDVDDDGDDYLCDDEDKVEYNEGQGGEVEPLPAEHCLDPASHHEAGGHPQEHEGLQGGGRAGLSALVPVTLGGIYIRSQTCGSS